MQAEIQRSGGQLQQDGLIGATKRKNAGLVSLWLGEELKNDVREACEARGYSQSGLARMLFGQWLSRHEGKRIKKEPLVRYE